MSTNQDQEQVRRSPWPWVVIGVLAVAVVVVFALLAGGDDEPGGTTTTASAGTTTQAVATTQAPATSGAPATTASPETTGAPGSTTLPVPATTTAPGPPTTTGAPLEPAAAAGAAAGWVAREYGAPDSEIASTGTGTLIDAMVALSLAEAEFDTASAMLDELQAAAADYVGPAEGIDPGAAGKVIQALVTYGQDPASFVAGRNFEAELRDIEHTGRDEPGRFGEAQVYSQSLAVLGLAMTPGGASEASATWLAAQACADGSFTFDGTGCEDAADADTTALVALSLIAAGETTAAAPAIDWLLAIQQDDGAIPGFGSPNANSTAIAAQAFTAAGETEAAAAAAAFLTTLQFGSGDDAGGIRWLPGDPAANTFATIQGIWGLVPTPLHLAGVVG